MGDGDGLRLLVVGLNYRPEPVGVGPFTAGLAEGMAARGHAVTVVCGPPYYPHWRVAPEHRRPGWRAATEAGVRVVRCPLHVPARPTGRARLWHHLSFLGGAWPAAAWEAVRRPPDLVLSVAPSLLSAPVARAAAALAGAPRWLHIQDLELEAAFATGFLRATGRRAGLLRRVERHLLCADRISAVSPAMARRLAAKCDAQVGELRNWAELRLVRPLDRPSRLRAAWGLGDARVALYSGSFAAKQGLELLADAARRLRHRRDLVVVAVGDGPGRPALERAAAGLPNFRIEGLQPADELGELCGLADVHLLPQLAGAADLLLPSKLGNMLASGRPVVATAAPGTGLAAEVAGAGLVVPPGDAGALAAAVERLLDDPAERAALGRAARARAEERWDRDRILDRFEADALACVAAAKAGSRRAQPA